MPAVSEKQATLFRIAQALKEGKKVSGKGPAKKIAKTESLKMIKEFTHEK